MRPIRKLLVIVLPVILLAGIGSAVLATTATTAVASPSCPNVGKGTGCAWVITVNPNGSVSIAAGANTEPYDGQDDVVVGVMNDSNGLVSSVSLTSSSSIDDIFGFDGDGICTYNFTGDSYCLTNDNGKPSYVQKTTSYKEVTNGINPYDYEGPDNTFSNISANHLTGTVDFITSLGPQGSTYFSLETTLAKTAGTAAISPDITVGTPSFSPSPVEGSPLTATASFSDPGSISPTSDFYATVSWGDGSPVDTTGCGTGIAGSDGSYSWSGSYTYAEYGSYTVKVTITDCSLALNTAFNQASVSVADAPLDGGTSVPVGPQTTKVSFTAEVATFTDTNVLGSADDFENAGTTISWGDGTSSTGNGTGTAAITITEICDSATSSCALPGITYALTGTHAYTANSANEPNGTYSIEVNVADNGGETLSGIMDTVTVADSVTSCGGSCTGSLTSGEVSVSASTDNSGDLLMDGSPNTGQINCGDGFDHAPTVISQSNTFSDASGAITQTETFPAGDGIVLNPGAPGNPDAFWVCFQANNEFNDISGAPATQSTLSDGTVVYTGLLPMCDPFAISDGTSFGPCVDFIEISPSGSTVTEQVTYPASFATATDPKVM